MHFKNYSLAAKLGIGFGAVLGVVALTSVFTVVEVRQIVEIERLNSVSDAAVDTIDQANGDLESARADARKLVLTGSRSDLAGVQSSIANLNKDLANVRDILAKDFPASLPELASYQEKVENYLHNVVQPEMDLSVDPATRPQAQALVGVPASAAYGSAVDEVFKRLREKVDAWSERWTVEGNRAMDKIQWVVTASGLICILLGLAMAWLIMRSIRRPLTAMTGAMGRLASGDHTVPIPALGQTDEIGQMAIAVQSFKEAAIEKNRLEGETVRARQTAETDRAENEAARAEAARLQAHVVDALANGLAKLSQGDLVLRLNDRFAPEYESLRTDFNATLEQLQETMKVVSANTAAIRSGTGEISSASDDLSRRTEQQAASLEETAAALDEITATVRKTAEGANHARKVVSTAKQDAEHSGEVVRQAVEAMSAIESSSRQITQIIGVIDEIAFQTNLLALNAGVEAARAGDAGRGFAVVASEVRGLAQRSAEAAKEIKALISTSSQQVQQGVGLVGHTGKALERIVAQVTEINGIVDEMAASAHEQSTALHEVNTAINQMDQVTQQNAAMVEQSTAASHALVQETDELARLIGRFQTGPADAERVTRMVRGRSSSTSRPVAAMKTSGRGGAALKTAPEVDTDWAEF